MKAAQLHQGAVSAARPSWTTCAEVAASAALRAILWARDDMRRGADPERLALVAVTCATLVGVFWGKS